MTARVRPIVVMHEPPAGPSGGKSAASLELRARDFDVRRTDSDEALLECAAAGVPHVVVFPIHRDPAVARAVLELLRFLRPDVPLILVAPRPVALALADLASIHARVLALEDAGGGGLAHAVRAALRRPRRARARPAETAAH